MTPLWPQEAPAARLINTSYRIFMDGPSHRPKNQPLTRQPVRPVDSGLPSPNPRQARASHESGDTLAKNRAFPAAYALASR
jgi:hypothetical protein